MIERLSPVSLSSKEHFTEFEKLLQVCHNLKSLTLIISNTSNKDEETIDKKLLKILIRSASTNLRKIKFFDDIQFSLKNLEEFLENWRGRPALSIYTNNAIYKTDDYIKLINKYKNDGVIKEFN